MLFTHVCIHTYPPIVLRLLYCTRGTVIKKRNPQSHVERTHVFDFSLYVDPTKLGGNLSKYTRAPFLNSRMRYITGLVERRGNPKAEKRQQLPGSCHSSYPCVGRVDTKHPYYVKHREIRGTALSRQALPLLCKEVWPNPNSS